MMSEPSLVEEIFLAALAKPGAEERAGYLEAACRGDTGLRQRVERLLEAQGRAGAFLEPAAGETVALGRAAGPAGDGPQAGAVIAGRFKLLEPIGEGGMGTVWVAEQTEPVRRRVALKLVKPGMDSKQVLARFEAERQALAVMDHPNIAKVLDGGLTDQGRPFFVMEYVKGVPITQYCDEARLSVEERLALFVPVCQAVQHAHQKGIVHRDLKPTNILVCLYDGKPVPKVIDFGLAKALHQPLTEHTLFTGHGVVMGTPLYMSPEQAELNNLDIDTRTDVYSLGVILYELLTGSTPLEKRRFQEAAWQEMLRLIKEEDPPRPSLRLSGTGAALSGVAQQRRMEPLKLSRLLRGDLDWIVMKALEKDRGRRYETADRFAADVALFLRGEPVSAVPPTAGYRLRKMVRKHRGAAVAAGLVLGALLAGLAGIGWGLAHAVSERRAAEEARRNEAVQRVRAEAARHEAERNAASLQIDRDLDDIRATPELGLLRLARTGASVPEGVDDLRSFAALAVLAAGQSLAPLLPPMPDDGERARIGRLAAGGRRVLTFGSDFTARLWDTRTSRRIAVLREGDEEVVDCGFSDDGRSVFTDAADGVARFWDAADGRLRARTEGRPDRHASRPADDAERPSMNGGGLFSPEGDRLITRRPRDLDDGQPGIWRGPVELWDAKTGRFLARLDAERPGLHLDGIGFEAGGRWVRALDENGTALLFSAADGQLVGRLDGAGGEPIRLISASPGGRRIAIYSQVGDSGRYRLRFWDGRTLKPEAFSLPPTGDAEGLFLSDEVYLTPPEADTGRQWALTFPAEGGEPARVLVSETIDSFRAPRVVGGRFTPGFGRLFDTATWQLLRPPLGRKYHPDLRRFAPDGRLVLSDSPDLWMDWQGHDLIDTRADKAFRFEQHSYMEYWGGVDDLDGFGWVALLNGAVRALPPGDTTFPPDLVELWAQVVARGELGPDGQLVRWDEPTWERKRRELAARPAPHPNFPFPGQVAVNRLHWLRREYELASDANRPRLARQLLERAESIGDTVEAGRWRTIVGTASSPGSPSTAP